MHAGIPDHDLLLPLTPWVPHGYVAVVKEVELGEAESRVFQYKEAPDAFDIANVNVRSLEDGEPVL
jgi:hypothetical protein